MKRFDIVVIGAGIHGAACAQAAAAGGYSCFVIEQYPSPARATSGRSSKLIHGGLRYLESARIRLVHECLSEQALLLKNAPQLVRLVPFHIPVYQGAKRSPWQIHIGLYLYYLLGGSKPRLVKKADWPTLDGLKTKGLRKVFQYWDAQTDDVALTCAVLRSAEELGAQVHTSSRFVSAEREKDGYRVRYREQEKLREMEAGMLINASGPWVNDVLRHVSPSPPAMPVDLVAGTHLVLPGSLNRGIYYMESLSDHRGVFVQPWKGNILLGTTETPYQGDPADVKPLASEVEYLLGIYNHYFNKQLTEDDVIESFAGLRVLPSAGGSVFHRTRETTLFPDSRENPRLYTIYGGKLTSYRATGERLIKLVQPVLQNEKRKLTPQPCL
jgi:glycerol-3-phosphate dehydrogenase